MPSNPTEQSIQESMENTGGIPEIEMELEVAGMMPMPVDKTLSLADMAADAKSTGDAIADINADIHDILNDIDDIEAWTGEDLQVSTEDDTTLAEKFGNVDRALDEIQQAMGQLTGSHIQVSDTDTTSLEGKFGAIDQDLSEIGEAMESMGEEIEEVGKRTAEDIAISDEDQTTVADALRNTFASTFPVGSIYICVTTTLPSTIASIGEWKEIKIPLTHGDMKNGTRNYEDIDVSFVAGNLHFWLRTK